MYEDLPTWLELSKHIKFKYLNEPTITYRVLQDSHSHPKQKERKFILLKAHYKMKKHFMGKYNVDEKIENEFELYFHSNKFKIAYNLNNWEEANDSFNCLKNHNAAGIKIRLKKWVMDIPILYKSAKSIKNLNPFRDPVTAS